MKHFTSCSILLMLFLSVSISVISQTDRKVAILDMTVYNSETSTSRLLSAVRVLRLIGVPHDLVTDLSVAAQYPVIITGSRINDNAFSPADIILLEDYVSSGGVLITSCLLESDLYNLCGISTVTSSNLLYEIEWDTTTNVIFDYVNDSMETTISLGRVTDGPTFSTRYYGLGNAVSIGNYENGECALAMNQFGSGTVYTFGPDFRDILYRNQTNFDVNAHRSYSNGFEPTSDVVMFVLRNIIRKHIAHTVYKYTQPYNATSTVIITHDIDSQTGIDTMENFSNYENSEGISALYNITTCYLPASWMADYYPTGFAQIQAVKNDGHVLASHSVGHFPDFADDTQFPLGVLGNTQLSYNPIYSSGVTTNGTVLGEVEVSKFLLETDHSVNIRSFRAGHLAMNDSLLLGLQMTGYEFNSTYSANDILSSFPFYGMQVRTFSGVESSVLEIPMTISDVFASDPITPTNYPDKVAIWTDATWRYDANHSPIVLLIHPNRNYKLVAMQNYLAQLPSGHLIYPFQDYGDFWRKRDSLNYTTSITANVMTITIDAALLTEEQSFVIDFTGLDTVIFEDLSGNPIDFVWMDWDFGSRLYYQSDDTVNNLENHKITYPSLFAFPNPTTGLMTVHIKNYDGVYNLFLYDLTGRLIFELNENSLFSEIDLSKYDLNSGSYILIAKTDKGNHQTKINYVR